MPFLVPSLDDRTYADLRQEAVSLIPVHDPGWTNHNASDPGITLVEMFAWLAEAMIFSLDQGTDDQRRTFLRLLHGPVLDPNEDADIVSAYGRGLEAATAATLRRLHEPYRAVTAADHEALALRAHGDVRRARCLPQVDVDVRDPAPAPGHVSLVLVAPKTAPADLCAQVLAFFAPRRLLTIKLHVALATMVPVGARIVVVARPDAVEKTVREAIAKALTAWLDPLPGAGGEGWRFDRPVYASDLYRLVEGVPGVDYVPALRVTAPPPREGARLDAPTTLYNEGGAAIGLALDRRQLPELPDAWADQGLRFVRAAVRLDLTVDCEPNPGASKRDILRALASALDDYAWSSIGTTPDLTTGAIRDALNGVEAVAALARVGSVAVEETIERPPPGVFLDIAWSVTGLETAA